MADAKITQLTLLTGASIDPANDVLAIVDLGADETKKTTPNDLKTSIIDTGFLQLQNGAALDATARIVTDQADTASPLKLSTGIVSVTSTLQIATNDTQYIDAEDGSGNNRFTVSKASGSQVVNVDFASNPTSGTDQVGAIRTYEDGANLSDVISFLRNGYVGIGTSAPDTNLNIVGSNQCNLRVESTITGGGIDLKDSTTSADNQVGVGAFGDALCFRSGGAAAGNMRLQSDGTLTLFGNTLRNFSAANESGAALSVTSANADTYNGAVYSVTGAVTVDVDDTVPNGFSMTIYQVDANQATIAAAGTLTLRNRQGFSQTAGQYAIVSLVVIGSDLVLTGDTA